MSYIVFARKYRPKTFDDIIGQSHITTTLKNAISQDRAAHSYLFAGPRGVGKTTTARIFAKALDCEKGPTTKPCNKCAICSEITSGSSIDILEIDGASNRGIDEIRNLRENVKFAPSKGKFRIYIIDEVHMLTPEAFNALLKTLEEPPPHVKFIFATTQPNKVPPTILSRCQRFNFRRIATADIFKNLSDIAGAEGLKVSDDALILIAKQADGSMRDAQVMLDQITSFTKGEVGAKDVTGILGIVEDDILFGLSRAVSEKDPSGALKIVARIIDEGKDPLQVVLGLIEHFRNISIARVSKDPASLIDAVSEKVKAYQEEAKKFSIEDILYIIYTLSGAIDFMRKSSLSRIPFEAALIKLTQSGSVISLAGMLDRIEKLEKGHREDIADRRPARPAPAEQSVKPVEDRPVAARPHVTNAGTSDAAGSAVSTAALDDVLSSWAGITNHVKARKMSIGSYLQEGYPVSLKSGLLTIGFAKEFQFHKEMLESPENKLLIREAVKTILGQELKIDFTLEESVAGRRDNMAYPGNGSPNSPDETGVSGDNIDPIVKTALEIFDGEVKSAKNGRPGAK